MGDPYIDDATQRLDSQQSDTPNTLDVPATIGRYRVLCLLGEGGFGRVYQAKDDKLDRLVAIKVPHEKFLNQPELTELYMSEARILASLDHPHIVPVYDVGSSPEFACYIVSKYIDGQALGDYCETQKCSIEQSLKIVSEIAEALHYAHKRGLVHRDVKPGNILVDSSGKPYLVDFGIALRDDQVGEGARYTGTPAYMSPEQARGDSHLVDGRSDIYSLGVVLYEMVSGQRPFKATTHSELLRQIVAVDAKPLRQIDDSLPEQLDSLVRSAMAKQPADRFATGRDFATAIQTCLTRQSPLAVKAKLPAILAAGALLVIALVAVAIGFWPEAPVVVSGGVDSAIRPESDADRLTDSVIPNSGTDKLGQPREKSTDGTFSRTQMPESAAPDSEMAQITPADVNVSIRVWGDEKGGVSIEQASPILDGDQVRFDVELAKSAHVYLVWIDAEGAPQQIFPNDPEQGDLGDEPRVEVHSPEQLDRGWPVVGKGGMETALVLVRQEPLEDFDEVVAKLQMQPALEFNTERESVWYEGGQTIAAARVQRFLHRGLGQKSEKIDDPVLQLMEQLRGQFDVIRAVRVAHINEE